MRLTLLLVCRVQAPEVYARNFGTQADMWSLGMLAYQALSDRCDSWDSAAPFLVVNL